MAGIGFQLRKILVKPTFGNLLKAYGYAALISSGPLIMSIVSLALLSLVLAALGHGSRMLLFFAAVTYVYSFTLIISGPLQLVLARYGADSEYEGHPARVFPFLLANLSFITPLMTLGGLGFFIGFVPAPLVFQLGSAFLVPLVSGIWLVSSYLTAMKNYNRVVTCFGVGYGSSFLFAWLFTHFCGLDWLMLGFAIGHMILFLLLFMTVYSEVGGGGELVLKDFTSSYRKYYQVALCGFFYNLAIWVDKFIFWWFAPDRMHLSGAIYAMPMYDQAVYLGFLSVIPGMAIFLLRLETDFALHYETFFKKVVQKASLATLRQIREEMIHSLTREVLQLIKIQGGLTVLLIILADKIMPVLGLGSLQAGVFQIVVLGSFLLVLFMSFLTVLFYLDKRGDALVGCIIFCVTNLLVTTITVASGEQWYGLGYVVSLALALSYAVLRVNVHLHRLEFDTFTLQPLYP